VDIAHYKQAIAKPGVLTAVINDYRAHCSGSIPSHINDPSHDQHSTHHLFQASIVHKEKIHWTQQDEEG